MRLLRIIEVDLQSVRMWRSDRLGVFVSVLLGKINILLGVFLRLMGMVLPELVVNNLQSSRGRTGSGPSVSILVSTSNILDCLFLSISVCQCVSGSHCAAGGARVPRVASNTPTTSGALKCSLPVVPL